MNAIIEFNKDSDCFSPENMENNRMLIKCRIKQLQDIAMLKGYMYMSEIYEALGVKWNPHLDNRVWIKGENDKIGFMAIDKLPKKMTISVVWPDK